MRLGEGRGFVSIALGSAFTARGLVSPVRGLLIGIARGLVSNSAKFGGHNLFVL